MARERPPRGTRANSAWVGRTVSFLRSALGLATAFPRDCVFCPRRSSAYSTWKRLPTQPREGGRRGFDGETQSLLALFAASLRRGVSARASSHPNSPANLVTSLTGMSLRRRLLSQLQEGVHAQSTE